MFKLKDTRDETIGSVIRFLRAASIIAWLASIGVFVLSPLAGFIMMAVSGIISSYATGRIFTVQVLHFASTIFDLRNRLLALGDREYVLRQIKADQLWRGETPDPRIEIQLAKIEGDKKAPEDFLKNLADMFQDLIDEKTVKKPESN